MLHEAEAFCRDTNARNGRADDRGPRRSPSAPGSGLRRHQLATQVIALLRAVVERREEEQVPAAGSDEQDVLVRAFLADAADLLDLTAPESLATDGPAAYINLSYRHAHGTRIYGGTSEVHRSVVAERALGMPRTRA